MTPRLAPPALCLALAFSATPAQAFVSELWGYFKQYQLGIDYSSSLDEVGASYETARGAAVVDTCAAVDEDATKQKCSVQMNGGSSSGFGLFLEQAFKRQGNFYLAVDVGFGVRYLQGALDERDAERSAAAGLPLEEMSFQLAALVVRPYLKAGITPAKTWPDLFVSLGPALQLAAGNVSVNGDKRAHALATSSGRNPFKGFVEVELVLWRFGEGALSLFSAKDFTAGDAGTNFYPRDIDGMSDVRAGFARRVDGEALGYGAKLLLNWP